MVGKGLKLAPHFDTLVTTTRCWRFQATKIFMVADFTRREHRTLAKRDFPEILSGIWKKYNPDTARGGFKGCGIYPFDNTILSPHSTKYSEPFGSYSRLLHLPVHQRVNHHQPSIDHLHQKYHHHQSYLFMILPYCPYLYLNYLRQTSRR